MKIDPEHPVRSFTSTSESCGPAEHLWGVGIVGKSVDVLGADEITVASEEQVAKEIQAEVGAETQRELSTPCMPPAKEAELHRALGHMQFRPWCNECVEGRARTRAHSR